MAPGSVRAADEPGAPRELHLLVERVEVILELHDELGALGTAALHAVADIEDHQAVVPIGEGGEPVAHVDVVQRAAGLGALDLPARDLFGMVRIADVDHPHRARRVVGQVHVAAIHVGAVHAAGDRLGELGDRLGMRGVLEGEDHDAVLAGRGTLTGHDAELAVFGGHHVVDDARVDDHRVRDRRAGRVRNVDGVDPVPDRGDVRVLAVGVQPQLGGGKFEGEPADDGRRSRDIPWGDANERFGSPSAQCRDDPVAAGFVGDEGSFVIDGGVPSADRRHRPLGAGIGDRAVRRIRRREGETDHVPGADSRVSGREGDPSHGVGDHGDRPAVRRGPTGNADRGLAGRTGAEAPEGVHVHHSGPRRCPRDRVVPPVVIGSVGLGREHEGGADQHARWLGGYHHLGRRERQYGDARHADGGLDLSARNPCHGGNIERSGGTGAHQAGRVHAALEEPPAGKPGKHRPVHRFAGGVVGSGVEA